MLTRRACTTKVIIHPNSRSDDGRRGRDRQTNKTLLIHHSNLYIKASQTKGTTYNI